jgi:hypothetical protein
MTNGQIAQLQELSKCHCLSRTDRAFIAVQLWDDPEPIGEMTKFSKAWLRRLTHQYRNQIAAMRKNRAK